MDFLVSSITLSVIKLKTTLQISARYYEDVNWKTLQPGALWYGIAVGLCVALIYGALSETASEILQLQAAAALLALVIGSALVIFRGESHHSISNERQAHSENSTSDR